MGLRPSESGALRIPATNPRRPAFSESNKPGGDVSFPQRHAPRSGRSESPERPGSSPLLRKRMERDRKMNPRLALEVWPVLEVWPTPWSAGDPPVAPPPLTRFLAAATARLDRKRPLQNSQACHELLAPSVQADRPVTCRHFLIAAPGLI